jgi:hypothetical protein
MGSGDEGDAKYLPFVLELLLLVESDDVAVPASALGQIVDRQSRRQRF